MRSLNHEPTPAATCSMFIPGLSWLQHCSLHLWLTLITDTPLPTHSRLCVLCLRWVFDGLCLAWRRAEELRWHSDPVLAPASYWSLGHNTALWLVRALLIPGQRPARDRFSGSKSECLIWVIWEMAGGMDWYVRLFEGHVMWDDVTPIVRRLRNKLYFLAKIFLEIRFLKRCKHRG